MCSTRIPEPNKHQCVQQEYRQMSASERRIRQFNEASVWKSKHQYLNKHSPGFSIQKRRLLKNESPSSPQASVNSTKHWSVKASNIGRLDVWTPVPPECQFRFLLEIQRLNPSSVFAPQTTPDYGAYRCVFALNQDIAEKPLCMNAGSIPGKNWRSKKRNRHSSVTGIHT